MKKKKKKNLTVVGQWVMEVGTLLQLSLFVNLEHNFPTKLIKIIDNCDIQYSLKS